MPGGFPIGGSLSNARSVGAAFGSYTYGGTTVTASATINTKGAYTQLTAATSGDTAFMVVKLATTDVATATTGFLVDIAVGASGSEVVIAANLLVAADGTYIQSNGNWLLPLAIPSGTRIAARCQCNAASGPIQVSLILYDGGFDAQTFAGVAAIGAVTTTSLGTVVALGNGVKGVYAQLIAATLNDYEGLAVSVEGDGASVVGIDIDVAIGASGSEVIVIPDLVFLGGTAYQQVFGAFLHINVPVGTRVAVRGSALAGATANITAVVYGLYK